MIPLDPCRGWRAGARLVAGVAAALLVTGSPAFAQEHHHQDAGPPAAPSYGRESEASSFAAGFKVLRSDGVVVDLAALKGPAIVTMFFATCPDVCPLMTEQIMQVEKQLAPAERDRLQVVFVSFDDRDQPEVLESYRRAHGIDSPRWTVALAPADVRQRLAAVLGVRFQKLPNGSFSHTAMVDLVDQDGRIAAQVPATALDDPEFRAAVRAIATEE